MLSWQCQAIATPVSSSTDGPILNADVCMLTLTPYMQLSSTTLDAVAVTIVVINIGQFAYMIYVLLSTLKAQENDLDELPMDWSDEAPPASQSLPQQHLQHLLLQPEQPQQTQQQQPPLHQLPQHQQRSPGNGQAGGAKFKLPQMAPRAVSAAGRGKKQSQAFRANVASDALPASGQLCLHLAAAEPGIQDAQATLVSCSNSTGGTYDGESAPEAPQLPIPAPVGRSEGDAGRDGAHHASNQGDAQQPGHDGSAASEHEVHMPRRPVPLPPVIGAMPVPHMTWGRLDGGHGPGTADAQ
jgi:hypothetical protein